MPTLLSSRFRCPDTKPQWISMLTLKPSHFRPRHKNQINAAPPYWDEFSTTHTTTRLISSYTGINSCSIPKTEIKSIWSTDTKTRSNFHVIKNKKFRPAYKWQVNFYHPQNNQLSPLHWNQVKFDPHTEIKSIWTAITKTKSILCSH